MEDVDYNPSRKSFIRNKWISTAASIWIQSVAGSLYTFTIYSLIMKPTQGYFGQSALNAISLLKDITADAGILSGLLYSASAPRAGPWLVLLAGAAQCFAGYFLTWLTVTGALPTPPPAVMCCYMLAAAHAMTFFNTANVVTGVHNFPSYGGTIVGIMKGFLGLSGAILILVYQTVFTDKPRSYLLLLALLPTITSLLLMGFVRILKTNEVDEKKHLNGFSFLAVILAAYLTSVIIIRNIFKLKLTIRVITVILLIILILSPIIVSIAAQRDKSYRLVKSLLEHNQVSDERDTLVEEVSDVRQEDTGEYHEIPNSADHIRETNNGFLPSGEDSNLMQAMRTLSFWLLLFVTACAMGSGLSTANNLSQIGESLGYTTLETNTLVSLWSIWNFLGSFGAGYLSDYFLRAKGCPRPLFIVITLGAMSIGHAVIALGFPYALYAGSVLVGVCYGSQWSLMVTIASELFGKSHLGTIFNTIAIAGPVGSYVLSVKVVGYVYNRKVSVHGGTCTGNRCFMVPYFIMASVTFVGFLVGLGLYFWTRKYYKRVVIRRVLWSLRQNRLGVVVASE